MFVGDLISYLQLLITEPHNSPHKGGYFKGLTFFKGLYRWGSFHLQSQLVGGPALCLFNGTLTTPSGQHLEESYTLQMGVGDNAVDHFVKRVIQLTHYYTVSKWGEIFLILLLPINPTVTVKRDALIHPQVTFLFCSVFPLYIFFNSVCLCNTPNVGNLWAK